MLANMDPLVFFVAVLFGISVGVSLQLASINNKLASVAKRLDRPVSGLLKSTLGEEVSDNSLPDFLCLN